MMTKEELDAAASEVIGSDAGALSELPVDKINRVITVSQYVTDVCLNELERRGVLEMKDGAPVVPYDSDHGVETILTRPEAA